MKTRKLIVATVTVCISVSSVNVILAAEQVATPQATATCKKCGGDTSSENVLGARTFIKKDFNVTEEQPPNPHDESGIDAGGAVSQPYSDAVRSPQTQTPE